MYLTQEMVSLCSRGRNDASVWWLGRRHTHQIVGCDGFAGATVADDHVAKATAHVRQRGGESQHGHDLTRHRDVKLALQTGARVTAWTRAQVAVL
jgi:hypothetical protein